VAPNLRFLSFPAFVVFASAPTRMWDESYNLIGGSLTSEIPMSDVYIYYFITADDQNGEEMISIRPATLEAIKSRGLPVMGSQIVVDHTELDADGFLVIAAGSGSPEINDLTAQIRSLEVRAASRDNEAIDSTDGIEKYMLSLESRELRKQARDLKSRRTEQAAGESGYKIGDIECQVTAAASPAM
jgi:hypothetical protein